MISDAIACSIQTHDFGSASSKKAARMDRRLSSEGRRSPYRDCSSSYWCARPAHPAGPPTLQSVDMTILYVLISRDDSSMHDEPLGNHTTRGAGSEWNSQAFVRI
jgi:hypothetical protein